MMDNKHACMMKKSEYVPTNALWSEDSHSYVQEAPLQLKKMGWLQIGHSLFAL